MICWEYSMKTKKKRIIKADIEFKNTNFKE